ncbi:putative Ig domain-containing protein [Dyella sp. M7H15-1]|uniref:putative Ig domain-containing protein n=1 Tax=Dyella sp. M7H15-1 TaxID=2501295 RepID=UPI0013E8ED2B|nr:putative Ig domain-containing protein [Dyella sp. M7H15-1]
MAALLYKLLLVLSLAAFALMPITARAGNLSGCPASFEVPASGSATLNTFNCSDIYGSLDGLGTNYPAFDPDSSPPQGPDQVNTTNGTAVNVDDNDQYLQYTNNGNGNTTDSYVWVDANDINHTETISILNISTSSLPNATVGTAYSKTISGAGGTTSGYSFSSTTLPAGLSLSTSGVLSGTPTTAGSYSFTVTLSDSVVSVSRTYSSFTVANASISISPSTLPNGTVASAYSQTITASGGTSPYTYAIIAGALPAGLSLNSGSGTISGTPTAGGTFTVTVQATDAGSNTASKTYSSWTMAAPTITVSPSTLPAATQGSSYNQAITASGGTSPYTYAVTSGSLPSGVTLSSSGTLSGTPTVYGNFTFTVTATDNSTGTGPYTGSANYTLTVNASAPTITTSTVPNGTVGVSYSTTISASGGNSPYTFSLASGSLPPGLSLSSSGVFSGTPTAGGSYTFTVRVTDAASSTATKTYSNVTISAPTIMVSPSSLPSATQNSSYSQTVNASGGTSPYTYAVTSGSLPSGVTLNASSGALGGTPTVYGNFSFTVTATDSSSGTGPYTGSANYTLTVNASTPTITTSSVPNGTVGVSYNQTISASNGNPPYTFSISSGSLPPGLSLSSGGVISGTPTAGGSYTFTVKVTDANSNTATQTYSGVTIAAPTLSISPSNGTAFSATYATAYSQSFSGSGGTSPYTFHVSSGSLPAGVSLSSAGVLSGTPTQAGHFSFAITATDSSTGTGAPFTATDNYSLTVSNSTITLTPTTLTSGVAGVNYSATLSGSGGVAPYSFSVTSGSLPAGISLSSSGVLSGTPTAAGAFNVTITATDANSFTGSQAYTLTMTAATISLSPSSSTLTVATAESAYSQTFTASGGTAPYHYTVTSGSLPAGLSLTSAGVLSGTPTVSGAYTFSVTATDSSTGTGAPFTGMRSYSLSVNAPTLTITPTTLPNPQDAAAYSQQLQTRGGTGTYTYSVSQGSLPGGLSLSSGGLLSGTPAVNGAFSFTVMSKDSNNFTASQSYSVNVEQAVPVISNDEVTTPADQPVVIAIGSLDKGGPINSVVIATAPSHGNASVNGLHIVYTPATHYFGTDTLTFTATGPGGTSAAATLTIVVTSLAVPSVPEQTVIAMGSKPLTINAVRDASGAPYTAVTITQQPSTGHAVVSGTNIVYTPDAEASGRATLLYTLTNPFGTSVPITVTIINEPIPMAVSQNTTLVAGRTAQVNLTQGAQGGPFTGAALISVSPASAGTALIQAVSGGYQLKFVGAPAFSGNVVLTFTLSNAFATSTPATVTIAVSARPDPSKDAQVLGVLAAQVDATRNFALGQINNFQQRLEVLHGGGGSGGFQNNLSFSSDSMMMAQQRMLNVQNQGPIQRNWLDPQPQRAPSTATTALPDGYAVWTGGAINFGSRDSSASANGFNFNTSGISAGVDKRISPSFAVGGGFGYGHNDTHVGSNGSRMSGDSYSLAAYASYSPGESTFIDGVLGYQWLSFNTDRYVTVDGNRVNGHREGGQWFASFSGGYVWRKDAWMVSPYGRVDLAYADLDGYTEQGDDIYALHYQGETVSTSTTSLGVLTSYVFKLDNGMVMPQLRLEYGHDFQSASEATMSYADLQSAGEYYSAPVDRLARNHYMLGIGVNWQYAKGTTIRLEYDNEMDGSNQNSQTILLGIQIPFNP